MKDGVAVFSLAGRTAFVTGAARGLGAAIARGLGAAGARVVLADSAFEAVEATAGTLRDEGLDAIALPLDVRDEAAFQSAFEGVAAHGAGIDVLVNNAAISPPTPLWSITGAEWDDVLAVNLRGCFFGCRIAGRHMRDRGDGRIVNLASIAGQQASAASGAHYAASKAGIVALTRSFAQELAPHGVTVNAVAPSAIQGPQLDALDDARRQALASGIPVGRFGDPGEVAAAVVYLASPQAGFVTGATLDLNGGRLMR